MLGRGLPTTKKAMTEATCRHGLEDLSNLLLPSRIKTSWLHTLLFNDRCLRYEVSDESDYLYLGFFS